MSLVTATPGSGGLLVQAQLTPTTNNTAQATYWLQVNNGTCTFDAANFNSVDYGRIEQTGNAGTTGSVTGSAAVSAGIHTVTLCGRTFFGATMSMDISLVATYVTSLARSGRSPAQQQAAGRMQVSPLDTACHPRLGEPGT